MPWRLARSGAPRRLRHAFTSVGFFSQAPAAPFAARTAHVAASQAVPFAARTAHVAAYTSGALPPVGKLEELPEMEKLLLQQLLRIFDGDTKRARALFERCRVRLCRLRPFACLGQNYYGKMICCCCFTVLMTYCFQQLIIFATECQSSCVE